VIDDSLVVTAAVNMVLFSATEFSAFAGVISMGPVGVLKPGVGVVQPVITASVKFSEKTMPLVLIKRFEYIIV